MKASIPFFFFALCIQLHAQTGSEIFLFDLKEKKGKITLANARNITHHAGYDNQPSFHINKPIIYYTSFNDEGRADIKSYNYKTKATQNITLTKEREYSPTLTPDQAYLSCIIQRDNGAQDLGKYPIEGGEATVLVDKLTVGYHAWADNSHLALFVLGKENSPNTLHYLTLPTKKDTILAENIGRSLHKIPKEAALSYVHKLSDGNWVIKKLNNGSLKSEIIGQTLPGKEDIAWTAGGIILSSDGETLYQLTDKRWEAITLREKNLPLKGITRLAVNATGDKLAVVVSE